MNIIMKIGGAITIALFLAFATGCANTKTKDISDSTSTVKHSGILSDYEKLKPFKGHDSAIAWVDSQVDWTQYDKVLIERMQVFLKEDSENKGIDPTDLKTLLDYFHDALVKEVEPTATIVDKVGPGVLRVRIAIVNLVPTSVATSLVGTAMPYGMAAELGAGMATGRPLGSSPYLGEAGIEAQFIDGVTAEVVGEFSDNEVGRKYVAELEDGVTDAAKKWADGYFGSFETWGYAKQAFDKWAIFFREQFNRLRGLDQQQ